jgi:hypothetical protein
MIWRNLTSRNASKTLFALKGKPCGIKIQLIRRAGKLAKAKQPGKYPRGSDIC